MSIELRTLCCVEMRGFDTGFSTVAMGLQPHYGSLISFGPFVVDDALLDYFDNGCLGFEVWVIYQASLWISARLYYHFCLSWLLFSFLVVLACRLGLLDSKTI